MIWKSPVSDRDIRACYIPVGCRWNSHGKLESKPQMLRQRLHPDLFGGVVTGVDHVHAEFHRVEVGVVCAFASDERVDAHGLRLGDVPAAAARDDPDVSSDGRAAGNQLGSGRELPLDPPDQLFSGQRQLAVDAQPLASIVAEPPLERDVEPPREDHVVADLGMDVERDVR